ncbi:antibiotic biosynthesis monooxygenase family protein [Corynebacterium uberis]|uniref:antibiotic biosynthesis monooxygenase family protein n=1 Tax=Corynebacterium TaxID=1716 RepID=UPI001D0A95C2|nr:MULTISPECIES: antibiotic biosynthesis monooxygenase [Corynebacterium]MCZ9310325.1 antibiotic biosynthesis monooxygenase [Corynebacterium sp. c6VSa_13]UDL73353.1 antibiotic biosynthesis monooxygenase [Corynebacterium uberis]UDL75769.1 antibiotic biosynthesis monooxygenase [Corynebacterium uberis]UDL77981.1 antibiotic biosynthesis monooxygenase [Corynebacterium uberis]UDL80264.1 antibiotic biosynthesis monooxygenase [Corynebacterium uberis]
MSIVKINALTVPEGQGEVVEQRFTQRKHAVDASPGFEGFQLLRPVAGDDRYFVVTWWKDEESYANWRDNEAPATHGHDKPEGERPAPAATKAQLLEFEVVLDSRE